MAQHSYPQARPVQQQQGPISQVVQQRPVQQPQYQQPPVQQQPTRIDSTQGGGVNNETPSFMKRFLNRKRENR